MPFVDHVNIVVRDLDRARRFYGEVLGLVESFRQTLEGEWIERVTGLPGVVADCVFFDPPGGGTRIELLRFRHPPGLEVTDHGRPHAFGVRHIAFLVDDLDAFLARAKGQGVPFYSEPVTVPFPVGMEGREKRLCYFRDPEGVLLEVAEYR